MNILAIDPAVKTGWAHSNGRSGVWDFSLKKDESVGVKFLLFRGRLTSVLKKHGIDLLVYEAPRGFGYWNSLVSHAKFAGVLEEFCAENDLESKGYTASKIKKHATAYGNATKEEMIERAQFHFRIDIIDDNHADALWLLDLAKKDFGV